MRSIICNSLIIYELESKEDIDDNEMISLCREIPNEKCSMQKTELHFSKMSVS